MAEDLTFYTNPMSRGRIARWMLEETGAPYETEVIAYGPPMKTPAYRAINPMGKVPAIVHGETVVTETAAICAYLADAFPEAGLAPELKNRGAYYHWLFFAAGPMEAAAVNKALDVTPPAEKEGMIGYGNYALIGGALEKKLPTKGFLLGDRFTAADVYVGANLGWGLQFGTIEPCDSFEDYVKRVQDRDAYHRAMALDNALMPKDDQTER
ncbi:MAG: glutathione S-transferase family protein [Geminicoccaceae bacterium]